MTGGLSPEPKIQRKTGNYMPAVRVKGDHAAGAWGTGNHASAAMGSGGLKDTGPPASPSPPVSDGEGPEGLPAAAPRPGSPAQGRAPATTGTGGQIRTGGRAPWAASGRTGGAEVPAQAPGGSHAPVPSPPRVAPPPPPLTVQPARAPSECPGILRRWVSRCRWLPFRAESVHEMYTVTSRELGRGQFGVVREARHQASGACVACKSIEKWRLEVSNSSAHRRPTAAAHCQCKSSSSGSGFSTHS